MMRPILLATLLTAGACAPGPTGTGTADPCAPDGHIHREPDGDWCHCDRGFRALEQGLGCEVDPTFTGRTTVELGDSDQRACWHAERGPFQRLEPGAAVTQFLTFHTVALQPGSGGLGQASVRHRAAVTAPHVLTVSRGANVTVEELLSSGATREVSVLVTRATARCAGLSQQFGFELAARVDYQFTFGPAAGSEVSFVLDQAE